MKGRYQSSLVRKRGKKESKKGMLNEGRREGRGGVLNGEEMVHTSDLISCEISNSFLSSYTLYTKTDG